MSGRPAGQPRVKQLTPREQQVVAAMVASDRIRWEALFGRNVWVSTPTEVAKRSVKMKGGRP